MKPQYIKIDEDGDKFYYLDREMKILHREDGPAFVGSSGGMSWYLNGKRHREDGPAVEFANGAISWYLKGEYVSEAEHARRTTKETVLTMDEIAVKFGVDVSKLKITK
jgi:hypothetical protein